MNQRHPYDPPLHAQQRTAVYMQRTDVPQVISWKVCRIRGGKFTGWCIGDQPHGYGRVIYDDPEMVKLGWGEYMGNWKNGIRHGHGTLLFRSGARYCGEWKDDQRDGYGVMCYDPKSIGQVIFVGTYKRGIIQEGTLSTVYDAKRVSYVGKFNEGGMGDDSAWVCYEEQGYLWANTPYHVRQFIGQALERAVGKSS